MQSIGLNSDFALQEPAVSATDLLQAELIEHGLARHLTWEQCAELFEIHEKASASSETRSAWNEFWAAYDHVVAVGRTLPNEPVKIAYYLRFGELVTGETRENLHPKFWAGATAQEAFLFKLHPVDNPGDHSGVPTLPRADLEAQLKVAATMPLTRWMRERIRSLAAESDARRHRRI